MTGCQDHIMTTCGKTERGAAADFILVEPTARPTYCTLFSLVRLWFLSYFLMSFLAVRYQKSRDHNLTNHHWLTIQNIRARRHRLHVDSLRLLTPIIVEDSSHLLTLLIAEPDIPTSSALELRTWRSTMRTPLLSVPLSHLRFTQRATFWRWVSLRTL